MKEFLLTISERLASAKLFDEFKGNISTLSVILEDVKNVVVTKEEFETAGLKKSPTDEEVALIPAEERQNVQQNWTWKDDGTDKAVSLGRESVDYLLGKINAKNDAGELTLTDKALISLRAKLSQ